MNKSIYIRPLFKEDWGTVSKIYQSGIDTKIATFETKAPKWKKWKRAHILPCCIIAQKFEEIVGFASLSPVSKRKVYKGVAEVSVYVSPDHGATGIGTSLLKSLITLSEEHGFWMLQASIFPDNKYSISLHKSCGFRVVGTREKIAQRDGRWHDNILLERRSRTL